MSKKVFILFITVALFISMLTVNLSAGEPDEEYNAGEAFAITFQSYFAAAMLSSMGGESLPGVEIEGEIVTFNNFEFSSMQMGDTYAYDTATGVIDGSGSTDEQVDLHGDFILTGGAVRDLEWEITQMDMSSGDFNVKIKADGKTYNMTSSALGDMLQ